MRLGNRNRRRGNRRSGLNHLDISPPDDRSGIAIGEAKFSVPYLGRTRGSGLAIMSGVSTKWLATDRLNVMEITTMVASHCDNTCTAFRTEPPLTKEVLDCAVTNFFPAGLGDMFSTKDGLLIVARVGIPNSAIEDYVRYLTSAEKKVDKQRETDEKKRQDGLQDRAAESGLPLE
jgi:hypothetical protein